jgi:hypothetical protein
MKQRYIEVDESPNYYPSVWRPLKVILGQFVIALAGTGTVILIAWLTMRARRGEK